MHAVSIVAMGLLPALAAATVAIPVTDGCASFPGFTSVTEPTSPFILNAVQNSSPINGNGLTFLEYPSAAAPESIVKFAIVVNNGEAKVAVRCNPTTGGTLEGLSSTGWNTLTVAPLDYDAEIGWGIGGAPVQAFWHDTVGSGGIFLGANGTTNFAIAQEVDPAYYYARLIEGGAEDSLREWEVTTFIQVDGS